jgi:hypothetical protein
MVSGMCTVIVLFQVHPAYPLVIAANRDERYARPSSGPTRLSEPSAAVAGRDGRRGGTWFGVNDAGVAVAVTDQGPDREDAPKRSRGLLVLDALACPTVTAVDDLLRRVDGAEYNPFALLYADDAAAWIGYHAGATVRREPLVAGMHILVSSLGSDHAGWRKERLLRLLDPRPLAGLPLARLVDTLTAALRHHAADPAVDDGICRHNGEHGTVSSFVALRAGERANDRLLCALGPPCRTAYVDYSHLLSAPLADNAPAPAGGPAETASARGRPPHLPSPTFEGGPDVL